MLGVLCVAFIFGIVLGRGAELSSAWVVAAAGATVLVAYVGTHARARLWIVPLTICGFVAGMVAAPRPQERSIQRGLARLEARVERVRSSGCFVRVESGQRLEDSAPVAAGLRVFVRDLNVPEGARVRLLVSTRPATRFRNISPHPEWLRAAALDGIANLRGPPAILSSSWPARVLHRARSGLRQRLDRTLSARASGMARALLLGEGQAVDSADADAFRGSGLAHVLAVSGLHVGLVAGLAIWGFGWALRGRVRDARRAASFASIPVVLGFAVMAGGAPSAWRAALTATLVLLCRAIRRRPHPVRVSAAAIILLALVDPQQVVRPAFLLSVMATAAVVTTELTGSALQVASRLSLRTTLATAPLVVWCFGGLPPAAVLANILVVPLAVFALVPTAFVHALCSGVGLESLTAGLFESLVSGLGALTAALSFSPALPPPSVLQGVGLCVGAGLGLIANTTRARAAVLAMTLVWLGAAEYTLRWAEQPTGVVRATFVDVGQGDAALVDMPDGRLVVIDAGGGIPDPGARSLLPLLAARRRDTIDLAIITHPHPDHFAGLMALLPEVEIAEVWHSGQGMGESPHGREATLLRALRRRGTAVAGPESFCEAPHEFGDARLEVLWPCPGFDPGFDPNDNSIVARITFGERRLLFTGDIEELAEHALAGDPRLAADVLKVPHHGSRTSSSDGLLDSVGPSIAVASCGVANTFGHPHREVQARYEARGVEWYRVDRDGGVIVWTDGSTIRAESFFGRWWASQLSVARSAQTRGQR